MSLIDRIEAGFTQNYVGKPCGPFAARLQPLSEWIRARSPDRNLKTTDSYNFSMCLRCAVNRVAPLILAYTAFWTIGIICIGITLWHTYPQLFHFGRGQARVWHGLWQALWLGFIKQGFIFFTFVPLAWLLFSLFLSLLRMFFWNRRAKRLRSTAEALTLLQTSKAMGRADTAQTDASVWPPPPKHDPL